jgi:D-glycero-alpha-D-manno-heptose-7-phosphate kinase
MIITKTPLRISFVGGGSDIIDDYNNFGSVISSTINKYVYVMLKKSYDERIRLSYSKNEIVRHSSKINHKLINKIFKYKKIYKGVELVNVADIPSSGSGLGSSSAFTVGLINAINYWNGKKTFKTKLALEAFYVEKHLMKQTIGYQDQSSAAFGGFNEFKFKKNSIVCNKLTLDENFLKKFYNHILIFHTGMGRKSEDILKKIAIKSNSKNFYKLSNLTSDFKKLLLNKDLYGLSLLINENWRIKRELAKNINNKKIDDIYKIGLSSGAAAGKLLGAGGGGHFLFIAKPEHHNRIKTKLNKLQNLSVEYEPSGSQIVLK